jgi:hypothetical protein
MAVAAITVSLVRRDRRRHHRVSRRVSQAAQRVDQSRLTLGLHLAAQVAHVYLEVVGGGAHVEAPDRLEQRVAGQDPGRVAHEDLQQGELGPGQAQRPSAPPRLEPVGIEPDVGERQNLRFPVGRRAPAQQCPHPGQQLLSGERLGQVVVGARVQPCDPVGDLVTGGQHQHRQIPTCGPQPPAGLQPPEAGHHHVEDQQIQRVTANPTDPVEHGETVGDGADVVTLDLEHPLQRLTDGRFIIRDHDPHAGPPSSSR